ncbi:hypothetical protein [Rhodovulum sp. ES.010]|uniref:hypothetical protein n=1 Tax=Rhodovulum sp. ES.010 TaxID=1882821 RepID=UPI000940FFF6|nr:hypothetical protein [Rhodovulum sp. ES.010]
MASIKNLTAQDLADIKARLAQGEHQHRIAARYDLNQGRISEIATGKRFATPAQPLLFEEGLPNG